MRSGRARSTSLPIVARLCGLLLSTAATPNHQNQRDRNAALARFLHIVLPIRTIMSFTSPLHWYWVVAPLVVGVLAIVLLLRALFHVARAPTLINLFNSGRTLRGHLPMTLNLWPPGFMETSPL